MKLHEFVKRVIAHNTLVRLWKPENKNKPYGTHVLLTDKAMMEWELLEISEFSSIEAIFITDIICETDIEAVNIVVNTEMGRDDIGKQISRYRNQRRLEKGYTCES